MEDMAAGEAVWFIEYGFSCEVWYFGTRLRAVYAVVRSIQVTLTSVFSASERDCC